MNTIKPVGKTKWEFSLKDAAALKALEKKYNLSLPLQEDISILGEPVKAGSLNIPNSLAVHPMEGCDGGNDGSPGPLTFRRYRRFAAGGSGLLWMEAIAVVPAGRANPRQLMLTRNNVDRFRELTDMMRAEAHKSMGHNPVIVAQLNHAGRYSKPEGFPAPLIVQRDPYRDPLSPEPAPSATRESYLPPDYPLLTDEYLDHLQSDYIQAAGLAYAAGFDAVDIKVCHGYLLNEILAGYNRAGKYGGSFENRTRFLLELISAITRELGKDKAVTVRLGIYDGIPYPFGWAVAKADYTKPDLDEPKKLISLLLERGVSLLNISLGNPYYNPHLGRPFNQEIRGGYQEIEHPVQGVARLIALTGEIQQAFPAAVIVGTGYSWLQTLTGQVGAGVKAAGLAKIIGVGRMAFAYPEFASDLLKKQYMDAGRVCVACSGCTQMMRDGTTAGCLVRDEHVYLPIFTKARKTGIGWLTERGEECIRCQDPMCRHACPTHIDIPGFIRKFLEGDIKGGYDIIRQSNVLAEVCSRLCPVEELCEGTCIQKYLGGRPVAIAAIQRYLCEQGNKNGWARVKYPAAGSGQRVAVLGGGPAGISAAVKLLEHGHMVTIFEKRSVLGGAVESVTPGERQGQALEHEVGALFKDAPAERLDIRLNSPVTADFNLETILKQGYEAVFIGMGLPLGSRMSKDNLTGLTDAMKFLLEAKHNPAFDIKDKRVAVIGGGSTAMDVLVSAREAGARDVYMLYRRSFNDMPAAEVERDEALYKGVHFLFLTQPVEFLSEKGRLTGIKICPTELSTPDDSGRRKPLSRKESSYTLPMDIVVEALGQKTEADIEKRLPGVQWERGNVVLQAGSYRTSRENVFAGGDIVNGGATVVSAVADGMAAAEEINRLLKKTASSG